MTLILDPKGGRLCDSGGRVFDPAGRSWKQASAPNQTDGREVSLGEAVSWLQRDSGTPCRVPVGVIGARVPPEEYLVMAEDFGKRLAELGLTVLCGGRQGIMEATCRGVAAGGGLSIGILPDGDPAAANPYVTVPIATGLGIARNAIVARAALCLIAIGGGLGTISEVALGLQFEIPVFTLIDGPDVLGVKRCDSIDETVEGVARVVLSLDPCA